MKNERRLMLASAVIAACALPAAARASQESESPLRILFVTPSGVEVPAGRQIVVQFDRKVVPVGRMERRSDEIPIAIEPASRLRMALARHVVARL